MTWWFFECGEALGAYPLTMEKREYAVQVNNHTVYAMCALDALAVSTMFKLDTKSFLVVVSPMT